MHIRIVNNLVEVENPKKEIPIILERKGEILEVTISGETQRMPTERELQITLHKGVINHWRISHSKKGIQPLSNENSLPEGIPLEIIRATETSWKKPGNSNSNNWTPLLFPDNEAPEGSVEHFLAGPEIPWLLETDWFHHVPQDVDLPTLRNTLKEISMDALKKPESILVGILHGRGVITAEKLRALPQDEQDAWAGIIPSPYLSLFEENTNKSESPAETSVKNGEEREHSPESLEWVCRNTNPGKIINRGSTHVQMIRFCLKHREDPHYSKTMVTFLHQLWIQTKETEHTENQNKYEEAIQILEPGKLSKEELEQMLPSYFKYWKIEPSLHQIEQWVSRWEPPSTGTTPVFTSALAHKSSETSEIEKAEREIIRQLLIQQGNPERGFKTKKRREWEKARITRNPGKESPEEPIRKQRSRFKEDPEDPGIQDPNVFFLCLVSKKLLPEVWFHPETHGSDPINEILEYANKTEIAQELWQFLENKGDTETLNKFMAHPGPLGKSLRLIMARRI